MEKIKDFVRNKAGYLLFLFVMFMVLFFCLVNANILHIYIGSANPVHNNSINTDRIYEGGCWTQEMPKLSVDSFRGISILFEKPASEGNSEVTVILTEDGEEIKQWVVCEAEIAEKSAFKFVLEKQWDYDAGKDYRITVLDNAKSEEQGVRILELQPIVLKIRAQVIKPIVGAVVFLLFGFFVFIGRSKAPMYRKYAVMAGILGACYLVCLPFGRVPDEETHFFRIFEVAEGNIFSETRVNAEGIIERGRNMSVGLDGGVRQHTSVFQDIIDNFDRKLVGNETVWYEFSNTALYSPISYLPQIIGVVLTKQLTEKVYLIIYATRILSFLISLAMITYALKRLPIKRECMLLIAMLPVFFQEMISLSIDNFLNALALFMTAYIFYIIYEKRELGRREKLILYALSIMLGLCKTGYALLILLYLLIPRNQFASKKQSSIFKAIAVGAAFGSSLLWICIGNVGGAVAGSAEGMSQSEWILKYPWGFINVAYRTVMEFADKVWLEFLGNSLGGLNIGMDELPLLIMGFIMLLYALIPLEQDKILPVRSKLLAAVIWMGILAIICGSMYLGYNHIGNYLIVGVQGRYLIPIAFLMLICMENSNFSVKRKDYDAYLYPFVGMVNLYALILIFTQMTKCGCM